MSRVVLAPQYPNPGPECTYEVTEAGGRVVVHVEGADIALDAALGEGSSGYCRLESGEIFAFAYEWVGEQLHLWLDGDVFIFRPAGRRGRRQAEVGPESADVAAPAPGKVLQVVVQVGDIVEWDQPVLVLESMKMEHTLRAARAGAVRRVLVAEGEQVSRGQVLVEVEESS